MIVSCVNKFKNIESEITNLIVKAFHHFNTWELSYEIVREFASKLITSNNKELYLTLYEGVRDSIVHRKIKVEKLEDRVKLKE